jgi:hypothetical protein
MAEDQPKPLNGEITHGLGGKFVKGNRAGPGRPKGLANKMTLTVRQAMEAAAAKVGFDGKGKGGRDGYLERVARDKPELFTHHYLRATVPPAKEPEPTGEGGGHITVVINSISQGQQFAPGNQVLMPEQEAMLAWAAYRAGASAWQNYLQQVESQLTQKAFQQLSSVVPDPDPIMMPAPAVLTPPPVPDEIDYIEPQSPSIEPEPAPVNKFEIPKYVPLPPRVRRDY